MVFFPQLIRQCAKRQVMSILEHGMSQNLSNQLRFATQDMAFSTSLAQPAEKETVVLPKLAFETIAQPHHDFRCT